jgi:hypothetical protein
MKFLPGEGTYGQFEKTTAAFPSGSRLEYRIQGDMYFDGDHSQTLGRALWVIEPDGSRKLLASGFVLYVSLPVAARNLEKCGIPFRVVRFYERKNGEQVETEISTSNSRLRLPVLLLLTSSNLWLGVIAGLFIHGVVYLIGVGTVAFVVLSIATVRSAASGRAAFLRIIATLPLYAAGYAVAVVLVRFAAGR